MAADIDVDLVLAPVDGSDASERAVEYAVAVAGRYGAGVHLLHVRDERVVRGLDAGDLSPETVAEHQRSFAATVRRQLPADSAVSHSSVVGFSRSRLARTPGSAILDAAAELEADFLVVPRVAASGEPDAVLGKAALHVLEYASQPVLSV